MIMRRPVETKRYVAIRFTENLLDAGIKHSVSRASDSDDKAVAGTVFSLFKTEVIGRSGPLRSIEAVEVAALPWGYCFNHHRLLDPIRNIPPAAAEARYYANQPEVVPAASFKFTGLRQTRFGSDQTSSRPQGMVGQRRA
jgi:putative transposase